MSSSQLRYTSAGTDSVDSEQQLQTADSADGMRHEQQHIGLQPIFVLQGFQFNHVGGGTKTRRPITLHMKYNKDAVQPCCFLMTEDAGEQEVTLEELQVCAQQLQSSCMR